MKINLLKQWRADATTNVFVEISQTNVTTWYNGEIYKRIPLDNVTSSSVRCHLCQELSRELQDVRRKYISELVDFERKKQAYITYIVEDGQIVPQYSFWQKLSKYVFEKFNTKK